MSVFAVRDLDGGLKLVKTRTVWDAENKKEKHIQEFVKEIGPWPLLALEPENEVKALTHAVFHKCLDSQEREKALSYLFGPQGIVRSLPHIGLTRFDVQGHQVLIERYDMGKDADKDRLIVVKCKNRDTLLSEPVWLTHERYLKALVFALAYALTLDVPQADWITDDTLVTRFNLPPLNIDVTDVAEFLKYLFCCAFERMLKDTKGQLPQPAVPHNSNSGLSSDKWRQVLSLPACDDVQGDPKVKVCTMCYKVLVSDMIECPGTLCENSATKEVSIPVLRIAFLMLGFSWARSESSRGAAVPLGDWVSEALRYQATSTGGPLIERESSWEMKAGRRQVAWALQACTGRKFTDSEARQIIEKIIKFL